MSGGLLDESGVGKTQALIATMRTSGRTSPLVGTSVPVRVGTNMFVCSAFTKISVLTSLTTARVLYSVQPALVNMSYEFLKKNLGQCEVQLATDLDGR